MLKKETLESAIISAAKLQGHELNGQDKLVIRTSVAACLAAKKTAPPADEYRRF